MVHSERHRFSVPEKRGSERQIQLEGLVLEPNGHSKGTILFVQGFPGGDGYAGFLEQLAEEFTVVTYRSRGRGESEGRVSRHGGDDVINVLGGSGGRKAAIIAHSIGAAFALQAAAKSPEAISSIYLINPYLGPDFLPAGRRIVPLGYAAVCVGIGTVLEKLQPKHKEPIRKYVDVHEVARIRVPRGVDGVPAAFALSLYDDVFGINGNDARYDMLVSRVREHVPNAEDYSLLLGGLNHNLLYLPGKDSGFAEKASLAFIRSVTKFSATHLPG